VAEFGNHRVQELTPALEFHRFIGAGELHTPVYVCADDSVIVVSEFLEDRVTVFARCDATLVFRFACGRAPTGLCIMPYHRHVAVSVVDPACIAVFALDGTAVNRVGVGCLRGPHGVACSAFGELIVADMTNGYISVYAPDGALCKTSASFSVCDVALHGCSIYGFCASATGVKCVQFV
jgi:hypothetical protein